MAEVNTGDGGGGGGKHQKKRAKKSSTKIDMTPMVDLAFLLLTFFVLTATFSKPKTMEINMPKVDKPTDQVEKTKIDDDLAHTVLIGEEGDVYYYAKKFDSTGANVSKIDLSAEGLRKIMQDKNAKVYKAVEDLKTKFRKKEIKHDSTYKRMLKEVKGDSLAPFVIVKTLPKSKYKTVIDVIDELTIAQVSKYTIVDMTKREEEVIAQKFPKQK